MPPKIAFVLGGRGMVGAHEVGMLRALSEAGIEPDVVLGTSTGAINGALARARPGDIAALTEHRAASGALAHRRADRAGGAGLVRLVGTHRQVDRREPPDLHLTA